MKLTMLGTGNAAVTECYNTCFVISSAGGNILVDGGGGSTLLQRLKAAGFKWQAYSFVWKMLTPFRRILLAIYRRIR